MSSVVMCSSWPLIGHIAKIETSDWSDYDNGHVSLVKLGCCHANSDWASLTSDGDSLSKQNESSHIS